MDDYTREMMDLKTLVTRTLEKKGVLGRIRAELRANVFAAIEEEDRVLESEGNTSFALLGTCNERAKQLHASPTGKLLTALVCDYFEWCQLDNTLKVYLPECNLPKDFWKSELKEKFKQKYDKGGTTESPLLLQILETYLKNEQHAASNLSGSFTKLGVRRTSTTTESSSNLGADESQAELEKPVRRQSATFAGSLPPLGRRGLGPASQTGASSFNVRNYNVGSGSDRGFSETQANGM